MAYVIHVAAVVNESICTSETSPIQVSGCSDLVVIDQSPPPIPSEQLSTEGYVNAKWVSRDIGHRLDSGLCLEIGPFDRPFLDANHSNARFMDYASREDIIANYQKQNSKRKDWHKVPFTNFIWKGQPYAELVGSDRFHLVLAAHVVEHVPDLVGIIGCLRLTRRFQFCDVFTNK